MNLREKRELQMENTYAKFGAAFLKGVLDRRYEPTTVRRKLRDIISRDDYKKLYPRSHGR